LRYSCRDSSQGLRAVLLHKKKGTGLGLAVSYIIVKRHGANIRVSSHEGKGAEFTIDLPSREKSEE